MERAVYDRMAEIDRDHWWFVGRRRIVETLLDRFRPKPGPLRILEVGCGTGSNITLLERFGEVDAIEPDDHAREFAAERTGLAIRGGYLPDGVVLEDGHYDLIVLLDVLEHIPEDRASLGVLRRKLAPGGRLLLTVPAIPRLWSAHDVAHHHQRRYTMAKLEQVVHGAGFRTVHRTHFNSLLLPVVIAVRLLKRLSGGKGGDDDALPSPLANRALAGLFGWERHAAVRGLLPLGISIGLVAEPAGGTTR